MITSFCRHQIERCVSVQVTKRLFQQKLVTNLTGHPVLKSQRPRQTNERPEQRSFCPFWRTIVFPPSSSSSLFHSFLLLCFRAVGRTTGLEFLDLPPSGASSQEFSLRGLGKFTSYQVVARAYNSQGEGPASTSVVATTLEDGE